MGAQISVSGLPAALEAVAPPDLQELLAGVPRQEREKLASILSELHTKRRQRETTWVVVTGGDSGIGPSLCKKLASEYGCYVFMGARDVVRGQAALKAIVEEEPSCEGLVEVVRLDLKSTTSVLAAAEVVKAKLGAGLLYAVVNNAETQQSRGLTAQVMISTHLYLCEAFVPLLNPLEGRIVNLGCKSRPRFARSCDADRKQILTRTDTTWEQVEHLVQAELTNDPLLARSSYGVSRACLAVYSQILAAAFPKIKVSSVPPGALDPCFSADIGVVQKPDESSTLVCEHLFEAPEAARQHYGQGALLNRTARAA